MNRKIGAIIGFSLMLCWTSPAAALVQFPYDIDNMPTCWNPAALDPGCGAPGIGAEDVDWNNNGIYNGPPMIVGTTIPAVDYHYYGGSDGFALMADRTDGSGGSTGRTDMYTFGFMDLTGIPAAMTMDSGFNKGDFPGPTLDVYEGQEIYLTLTNFGMKMRPDLFDPHTVHFHGFPNAATIFDGEPMASIAINMSADLTYYYNIAEPGTYMYHCHVEATEHMEMGMLANQVTRPRQELYALKYGPVAGFSRFAYNDCDNLPDFVPAAAVEGATKDIPLAVGGLVGPMCGASGYDVEALIKFSEFDPEFHKADLVVQPLPFAGFEGKYFMINGRGYPDTINIANLSNNDGYPAQKMHALVTATVGQRILFRIINLSVQNFTVMDFMGLTARVVGKDAKLQRGPDPDGVGPLTGKDLTYTVNSIMVGPGQSYDVVVDTTGVPAGTYYLYSRMLNQLNNNQMDRGGVMTEIRIN